MPPLLRLSRTALRTRPLTRHLATKPPFAPNPAPPRLPPDEQALFERLQAASTGAFSTPRPTPQINQSPHSTPEDASTALVDEAGNPILVEATGAGEELHPDIRRGGKPEFEGDVNPKTGEVGGPKNEPLRWGGEGDWSYNGRVTDF